MKAGRGGEGMGGKGEKEKGWEREDSNHYSSHTVQFLQFHGFVHLHPSIRFRIHHCYPLLKVGGDTLYTGEIHLAIVESLNT